MHKLKWLTVLVSLGAILAIAAACTSDSTPTPASENSGSVPQESIGIPVPPSSQPGVETGAFASVPVQSSIGVPTQYSAYGTAQVNAQQSGIWVTGLGKVAVTPDLAILNLGVESRAKTVENARSNAASTMDSIIKALKRHDVADKDIQTQFFNIRPEYQYVEVTEGGIRRGKQELVGYIVSNTVIAKIRNLDSTGEIIDDVVASGGDLTRINSISFTLEDTTAVVNQVRELAVKNALDKARQFANLTGVTLGKLLYIAETGGSSPVIKDFSGRATLEFAAPAAVPQTPISTGELDVQLTIQAVFEIQ